MMTETQKEELHRYQQKERNRENLFIQQKQKLESEFYLLQKEIRDLTSDYNEKLKHLKNEFSSTKKYILQAELYQSILAQKIFEFECQNKKIMTLRQKLQDEERKHSELIIRSKEVQTKFLNTKEALHKCIFDDKMMEKQFKRKIQTVASKPLDQETVRLLYQFFKIRSESDNNFEGSTKRKRAHKFQSSSTAISRRSSIGRQSGRESNEFRNSSYGIEKRSQHKRSNFSDAENSVVGSLRNAMKEVNCDHTENIFTSPNDPYSAFKSYTDGKTSYVEAHDVEPISKEFIPEGFDIDNQVWNMMQKLRLEKIEHERRVKSMTATFEESKEIHENIRKEEIQSKNNLTNLKLKMTDVEKEQRESVLREEILVSIRYGQNEVPDESQADYHSTSLVPINLINRTNKQISSLGKEKIQNLKKLKNSSKILNHMKWNDEVLDMKLNHCKDLYVDFQLLRLNTQVKMLIAGTNGDEEALKNKKLQETRSERQKTICEQKINKIKKQEKQLQQVIEERNSENLRLEVEIENLQKSIDHKEKSRENVIKTSAESKMAKIAHHKQLQTQAQLQAQELQRLRTEVDKMRLKTFPSFAPKNWQNCHGDER